MGRRQSGHTELLWRKIRSLFRRLRRWFHHRDEFVICGASVRDHTEMTIEADVRFELVSAAELTRFRGLSPFLSDADIDDFRSRDCVAVVANANSRPVAVNVFVRGPGTAWVSEFGGEVPVESGEHFSCRTFVDPSYRGRGLSAQMKTFYRQGLPADDRLWALIMARNRSSLRGVGRCGWVSVGRWTATTVLGRIRTEREDHEPLPLR